MNSYTSSAEEISVVRDLCMEKRSLFVDELPFYVFGIDCYSWERIEPYDKGYRFSRVWNWGFIESIWNHDTPRNTSILSDWHASCWGY